MVAEKVFREDLYFRINVFRIDLPPLRERSDDVPLLAAHFLQRFATKAEKEITEIDPDALAALVSHDWPGNVRELANVIERGVVVGEPPALRLEDLPLRRPPLNHQPGGDSLSEIEKVHIARVLERLGWNISQAARTLEVDRATLYSKIKRYGLRK
jgi:DNA-binding NtrC family response regulator